MGKPETGLHPVQVMLLYAIAVTLWGSLKQGFTLSGNVAMYYCCDTVRKTETMGSRCPGNVAMYYCCDTVGKPETGLHAVQVMLLCTIAVTLWGSMRLGFTLSR